ncbi:AMP-binding protein [Fictibacillus nanhaiensis]|uniref:phenylacetate--CoA ligase family protein n=1 Tax=Fictibacillus nanhaiensis TaxID=742169 RepID=UPI0020425717|nr:AMP-binding protein [Fictibacillus nanhaiensis]MCM3733928.1 AMP-binding protein [Fictibacillus nanhaiensis]
MLKTSLLKQWPPQYDSTYLPDVNEKYWYKEVETASKEELDELVFSKLKNVMNYAYENSGFYQRKWKKAGFHPNDIQRLTEYDQVPITTKAEVREDLEEHAPFGSNVCIPYSKVHRIQGTSGTTGKPTVFSFGKEDWERIAHQHARIMWSFGMRPDDLVFIASPLSLYIGSWGALIGAERLGAKTFPFGAGQSGQTEKAVSWLKEIKPTVFYGTPSYALYLAEKAKELGVDPKEFGFRILFFSGEPGAGVLSTKKKIEETYGGICIDSGTMAEVTPWMSNTECEHRQGVHLWQDVVYTEVVDQHTKKLVPFGGEGVPVYTPLERTSQPVIRYWSGDLTTWTDEPCPCGRVYPRLPKGIYGRIDDMVTVRGVNVYASLLENVIRKIDGLGEEFVMIVTRENIMDEVTVQCETVGTRSEQELIEQLSRELKREVGVTFKIDLLPHGTLERTQFKAKRVIDHRNFNS